MNVPFWSNNFGDQSAPVFFSLTWREGNTWATPCPSCANFCGWYNFYYFNCARLTFSSTLSWVLNQVRQRMWTSLCVTRPIWFQRGIMSTVYVKMRKCVFRKCARDMWPCLWRRYSNVYSVIAAITKALLLNPFLSLSNSLYFISVSSIFVWFSLSSTEFPRGLNRWIYNFYACTVFPSMLNLPSLD